MRSLSQQQQQCWPRGHPDTCLRTCGLPCRKEQRAAEAAAKAAAAAARTEEAAAATSAGEQDSAAGSAAPLGSLGSTEAQPEQDPVRLKPKANQRQRPTAQPPAKQPGELLQHANCMTPHIMQLCTRPKPSYFCMPAFRFHSESCSLRTCRPWT